MIGIFWAEEYDHDLNDVIALQGEVAQTIADRIELKLTSQEHAALAASDPG